MMYNSKFILCVKQNNKILREEKDSVLLPFGSEYTLLLKNLESKKALVKITIDGEDVLDGQGLIIQSYSTSEVKGFLQGSCAKKAFKFIEKTQEISNFRGDRIDDSLIRVEVYFEKVLPACETIIWYNTHSSNYPNYTGAIKNINTNYNNSCSYDRTIESLSLNQNIPCMTTMEVMSEDGITVKGSEINQNFSYGVIGDLEHESIVLVLKLKGHKENKRVQKITTVSEKKICPICGKKHKMNSNFCSRCGTNIS